MSEQSRPNGNITRKNLVELEHRVLEAMRDMQTEILRGLERCSRDSFSRMHQLESSDNDPNERINALEERVTALETRPPRR